MEKKRVSPSNSTCKNKQECCNKTEPSIKMTINRNTKHHKKRNNNQSNDYKTDHSTKQKMRYNSIQNKKDIKHNIATKRETRSNTNPFTEWTRVVKIEHMTKQKSRNKSNLKSIKSKLKREGNINNKLALKQKGVRNTESSAKYSLFESKDLLKPNVRNKTQISVKRKYISTTHPQNKKQQKTSNTKQERVYNTRLSTKNTANENATLSVEQTMRHIEISKCSVSSDSVKQNNRKKTTHRTYCTRRKINIDATLCIKPKMKNKAHSSKPRINVMPSRYESRLGIKNTNDSHLNHCSYKSKNDTKPPLKQNITAKTDYLIGKERRYETRLSVKNTTDSCIKHCKSKNKCNAIPHLIQTTSVTTDDHFIKKMISMKSEAAIKTKYSTRSINKKSNFSSKPKTIDNLFTTKDKKKYITRHSIETKQVASHKQSSTERLKSDIEKCNCKYCLCTKSFKTANCKKTMNKKKQKLQCNINPSSQLKMDVKADYSIKQRNCRTTKRKGVSNTILPINQKYKSHSEITTEQRISSKSIRLNTQRRKNDVKTATKQRTYIKSGYIKQRRQTYTVICIDQRNGNKLLQPVKQESKKKTKHSTKIQRDDNQQTFRGNNNVSIKQKKCNNTKLSNEKQDEIYIIISDDDEISETDLADIWRSTVYKNNIKVEKINAETQVCTFDLEHPFLNESQVNDQKIEPISPLVNVNKQLKIGFLGLSVSSRKILPQLKGYGFSVYVWDYDEFYVQQASDIGAITVEYPSDVLSSADIILSCFDDLANSKKIFENIITSGIKDKGYVEMGRIDSIESKYRCNEVKSCEGRYIEAQLLGIPNLAENNTIVLVAAGDKCLWEELHIVLQTIAHVKFSFSVEVGYATNTSCIYHQLQAICVAAFSEALGLAEKINIDMFDVIQMISHTKNSSPFLLEMGRKLCGFFNDEGQSLEAMKSDLNNALIKSNLCNQSVPLTAIIMELIKVGMHGQFRKSDMGRFFESTIVEL